ncbi:ABC transporter substrate-binding protein [Roseomonas marmotae]|uniref:ABC transporter substrate-binding protein n=1 Tax=Roseomonas marmotae TaxID=2768161 RepID=A0ABS3KED1_9PROT|nr:ABC transporter substrate-binding protein [Roseomonas marmotae]MBO1075823.1 ABC transporter substrate-binding protein [Roseomonas marmotae]QTI81983.1 ABC transporter substrate-binding protein [Roseomonas marmotae]
MNSTLRAALLGCALLTPLAAGAEPLSMAVSAPPASIDPHYYTLTPSIQVSAHMFEALTVRDPNARVQPALAESWRLVDDTTWEFKLRPGVKFHNGADFTAEDVAYTLKRVPTVQSPSSFAVYIRAITDVQVVDPLTIRLKTANPYPLLPNDLAQIYIVSRSIGDDVPSSDFNSGKATIGTGPFRFTSYDPNNRVEMTRNDAYWGTKPAWDSVNYRIITNSGARVAALLSGDVAMIDNVPTADVARLRKDNRIAISEGTSLRLIFLGLDVFRDSETPDVRGPNGEALPKNPLQDKRVREALSIAINRPAITQRIMEDVAVPTGQFMPPGAFGYNPDIPVPKFDADRARKLLAEAGYPNGLTITLRGPNDRYINDAQILQVVAQMWARIGIKTQVEASPLATLIGRLNRLDASVYLLGWSNSTGEPSTSLRAVMGTRAPQGGSLGLSNYGRYSNPRMDAIAEEAMRTLDNGAREKLMQQAMKIAMDDVAIIPLHIQKSVWATRSGLSYTPRLDEQTLATGVLQAK